MYGLVCICVRDNRAISTRMTLFVYVHKAQTVINTDK